jgi:hypothetical protein
MDDPELMEFWAQFISSVLGALVGGGIAALVAWRVFAAERQSRNDERADTETAACRGRVRQALERMSELLQEMLVSVPTDAGTNAPAFTAQRFAFATQSLAYDLPRPDYAEVEAWVNGLLGRYIRLAQETRIGSVTTRDVGDLVSLAQQRLQMWFLDEAPVVDFALSDESYIEKYPQVVEFPEHADSPKGS